MNAGATPFPGAGLRTEQAPPLAIPMGFFLAAPVALMVAGALLLGADRLAVAGRWSPVAMAVTHLGTLGFLGATMLGALYQMVPVVAGAPVPGARLAHAVQALLVAGVGALVGGFLLGEAPWFWAAATGLAAAFALFVAPVALALARAPVRSETVIGMRLALLGLVMAVVLGLLMAAARGGWTVPASLPSLLIGHVGLSLVVWVGGLIGSVSWQVVPMFYLAPEVSRLARRLSLAALATTLVWVTTCTILSTPAVWVSAGLGPGAIAVWGIVPATAARTLRQRRRQRRDASLQFWWLGLGLGPVALALAAGVWALDSPRLPLLLGWTIVYGWAGLIAHGMLTRIAPFLVWFHRYAARVGLEPVPAMRQLLPDRQARRGLFLHSFTVIVGAAAILTGVDALVWAAGVGLIATGAQLFGGLLGTLRRF